MIKITSIKCPHCGANLEIDEKKKFTRCQYCNTNLVIEKDINDEIKASILENTKIISKIFPIVFITVFVIIFISIIAMFSMSSNLFSKSKSNFDIKSFNNSFTYAAGTKNGIFVTDTLDNVISSNKQNKKHQIYVKYDNSKKTNNENKIIDIKNNLSNLDQYEVIIDFDSDGYVNLITIENKK